MGLLFAFPLRTLCRLGHIDIEYVILLSGLISYIVAKVNQNLKANHKDINITEFLFIFSLGMATTSIFIILGCPLLALSFNSEMVIESGKLYLYDVFNKFFSQFKPETISLGVVGESDLGTKSLQSEAQNASSTGGGKNIAGSPSGNNSGGTGSSSLAGNIFHDQISAIDRIIEERNKLLNDFKKLSKDNSEDKINEKMDMMLGLASKNQELRLKLLTANKDKFSLTLLLKMERIFNEDLQSLWYNYNNSILSLDKTNPNFSKQEYDIHNSYIKKRNSILESLVQDMQHELKKNDRDYYTDLNNKVLKKFRQDVESSQREIKSVQTGLATLINTKNKK